MKSWNSPKVRSAVVATATIALLAAAIITIIVLGSVAPAPASGCPVAPTYDAFTPTPTEDVLPLPLTGLICTFPVEAFETLVDDCIPATVDDVNTTYCEGIANATDFSCVVSACTVGLLPSDDSVATFRIGFEYENDPGRYSYVKLVNNDTEVFDGGDVKVVHLLHKYIADNAPTCTNPVDPAPQTENQSNGSRAFTVEDYEADTSFGTLSVEFGRQMAVLAFNREYNFAYLTGAAYYDTEETLVVTSRAARCDNPALAAIPWMNETTDMRSLRDTAIWMLGLNVTADQTLEENWPDECMYWTEYTPFCEQFTTGYYSIESLRDPDLLPSPIADLVTVITAYNNEYTDCGVPRGCFGVAS